MPSGWATPIAFPGVLLCAVLLILDLGRPERFWHMVIKSHYFPEPIFKYWSPISIGVWVLSLFGAFAFVSFIERAARERQSFAGGRSIRLADRLRRATAGGAVAWSILGAFFGLFLAGYTGVLMVGTVTPVWHNAVPLGGLFLASALSTLLRAPDSAAGTPGRGRHSDPTVAKLSAADRWAAGHRAGAAGAGARSPWRARAADRDRRLRRALLGRCGARGTHSTRRCSISSERPGNVERQQLLGPALILVGGLALRFVIVMAPQWPPVKPWHL